MPTIRKVVVTGLAAAFLSGSGQAQESPSRAQGGAAPLPSPTLAIRHEPAACVIAARYPLIEACFEPAARVRRARVYFRAGSAAVFHFVEMSPQSGGCYRGTLPPPSASAVQMQHYVAATDQDGAESRTETAAARIVSDERSCPSGSIAPLLSAAQVEVGGGGRPEGFQVGGGPSKPLVAAAIVGVGAAATAGALLAGGGGSTGGTSQPTTTSSTVSLPPATTTTTTTSTTTTTRPPGSPPTTRPPTTTTTTVPTTTTTTSATTTTTTSSSTTTVPTTTTTTTSTTVPATTTTTAPPATTTSTAATTTTTTTPTTTAPAPTTTTTTAPFARVPAPLAALAWTSELAVGGGRGQVVANGTEAVFPGAGRVELRLPVAAGANHVEAVLVDAQGAPGTWRFTAAPGTLRPGSLRAVAGDVREIGAETVSFRLRGRPGERVVFAFEAGRAREERR